MYNSQNTFKLIITLYDQCLWKKNAVGLWYIHKLGSQVTTYVIGLFWGFLWATHLKVQASDLCVGADYKYRNCIYWIVKWATCINGAETSVGGWLRGGGASSWVVTGRYSISFSTALEHSFMASALLLPSNCILIIRLSPCRNPQIHSICVCQSQLSQLKTHSMICMLLLWNQHLI